MKKIGILGGSFNPVHLGHLQIAEDCIVELGLEKVIFLPNSNPPHREIIGFSFDERVKILEKSIEENVNFEISKAEMDSSKIHYSYNTISENFVSDDYQTYFIMGDDEFLNIEKWYRWEEFLKICGVIVFLRNHNYEYIVEQKRELIEKYNIVVLKNSMISISSSDIRKRLKEKKSIRYLVNPKVFNYIELLNIDLKYIEEDLKSKLSENRFKHSLRVADYCVKLARIYGENEKRAYLAGLIHDCAKGLEEFYVLKNIVDSDILDSNRDSFYLLHSNIGEKVAKKIYGINDEKILNAIKYHTTGRANMSLLEKIIFISDKIEPNRDYKDVENLRKIADEDIDLAIIRFLYDSFEFRKSRGETAHKLSYEAYDFLKNER